MWTQRNERFRWNLNGRTCAHCKLPLCLFAIFVDPYNKFRPFILRRSQCVSAASVVACFICAKILLLILHTRVRSHLISSETAACMAHTVMFTHCYLFVRRRTFFFWFAELFRQALFWIIQTIFANQIIQFYFPLQTLYWYYLSLNWKYCERSYISFMS